MKRFYAKLTVGNGMHDRILIDAKDFDDAEEQAYDACHDLASSYGYDTDEDHFGDLDSVGKDWCDDLKDYEDQGFLECEVEEYNPDIHGVT